MNDVFHSRLCKCYDHHRSVFISFQHRPPMKKVRKSLALDVVDGSIMPKSKRKSIKHNIKVILIMMMINLFSSHPLEFILIPLLSPLLQEEPVIAPLSSSSFCSKQSDNILDQGFLLGPSDSTVIPSLMAPLPVSLTFICNK